ncbi:hypothetical protein QBC38DRAFT_481708 [Podospora fimiseda]|uniref:Mid2 domain-containing protein n=1 Tax=Podospora fimiseda TaxID=252190 RepID=A0AAN7BMC3_9PEZI|nr:hypothetical protein QBC38DRAFT_481708 [Podospora fimiseda]
MAPQRLNWLVAASAWLPMAYSSIAGTDAGGISTSPAKTLDAFRQNDIRAAPAPTPAPRYDARGLLKRQDGVKTCGYVNGARDEGYVCVHSEAVCIVNNQASAIGCCAKTDCNIWTACLPYLSSRQSSTLNMDVTRYCSEASAPYCATMIYADPEWLGYTVPTCYSEPTTLLIYASAFGAGGNTVTNVVTTPVLIPTPGTSTGTRSTPTGTTDRGGVGIQPDEKKESVPLGPIIGGVVGGLIFLAGVAVILFFVLRRKPKKAPVPVPAPVQVQQVPVAPGPGFSPYLNQAAAMPPKDNMTTAPNAQFLGTYPQVDNRPNSMLKPGFDNTVSPVPSPGPGSPPPMYNTPQPVSPQFTGQTAVPAQPVSPQFTGQTASPVQPYAPQGQQPYGQQPPQQQQHAPAGFVAELSTQKGDGQVHEAP